MADYIKEHYDFPLTKKSQNKPLKGVRVIDAGNMVAAPFATVLLADFGAEVDRKSTRLNSSHIQKSRMPSSA